MATERVPDTCHVINCYAEGICLIGGTITHITGLERCVLPELQALWAQGIQTVCSCCGHGDDSRAYIRVYDKDAEKMRALGYEPYEPHACMIYAETVSFRAKYTAEERAKPAPPCDPEEVRAMWRGHAHAAYEVRQEIANGGMPNV